MLLILNMSDPFSKFGISPLKSSKVEGPIANRLYPVTMLGRPASHTRIDPSALEERVAPYSLSKRVKYLVSSQFGVHPAAVSSETLLHSQNSPSSGNTALMVPVRSYSISGSATL